ncbi:hypothetical protein ANN_23104, partial [Periplaneta americana]
IYLVLTERAVITRQPGDGDEIAYCAAGSCLQLECEAFGVPPPTYVWYKENEELVDQRSNVLQIKDFSFEHEGEYTCYICQEFDEEQDGSYVLESNTVEVKILPTPPIIHEQPLSNVAYREGDVITLTCIASAYPDPEYEWWKNNEFLEEENTDTLTIHSAPVDETSQLPRLRATEKVALLIGNDLYNELTPLHTPRNDVVTIANILKDAEFKVIALHNLTLQEMRNAVSLFCKLLPDGAYAFFYFAGHGFNFQDGFMLPVDAPGPKEYRRCNSLSVSEVIKNVMEKNPRLFLMLLDSCLKVPDRKENPCIHEELPHVFNYTAYRNLIYESTTTFNMAAYEKSKEKNSIYVSHLKNHLAKDIPVLKMLDIVRREIAASEEGHLQIPFACLNIVDDFHLTDEVIGCRETETEYQKLMTLPALRRIKFENIEWESVVKIQPHRNCFLNSLDILINHMANWKVVFRLQDEKLKLEVIRERDVVVLSIHDLQKTKMPIVLSAILKDCRTGKEVGSYTFDLKQPLIMQGDLWFTPPPALND